jgi:hypothetical protein
MRRLIAAQQCNILLKTPHICANAVLQSTALFLSYLPFPFLPRECGSGGLVISASVLLILMLEQLL